MIDHHVDLVEAKIELTETEALLYYLADGDLSKIPVLKQQSRKEITKFYYFKRLNQLNTLKSQIADLEHIKSMRRK